MKLTDVDRIYGKRLSINSRNKRISDKNIRKIIRLHNEGLTVAEIFKRTRVLKESIRYYINQKDRPKYIKLMESNRV